jgi:hypothetical protein
MKIQGSIPIWAKENLQDMVEGSRPIQPSQAANARNIPDTPSRQIPDTAIEAIKVWMTIYNKSSQAAGEDSEFYGSEASTVIAVVEIAPSSFRPRNDTTNQVMSEKLYKEVTTWMEKQGEEYEDHNSSPALSQGIEWGKDLPELSPNDCLRLARKNRRDEIADGFGHRVSYTDRHIVGLEKLHGEYDRYRMGSSL